MRAVVIEAPHKIVVKEIEKPKIGDDEILIKVQAASICNATDSHIFHGSFDGYHDFYPQIAGHEVAGEVVEIGKNVEGIKPGDLVAEYTPRGAFCEYAVINPKWDLWVRIPESIPMHARSIVEMFHGAYVCTVYPAQIQSDETVLVVGQGPMGLTAMLGARQKAKKIITVDFYENRLAKSLELGADVALDRSKLSADEIVQRILDETDGNGVDVTIMAISEDRSDASDAYDMAIAATKMGGRMTGLFVDKKNIGENQRINPRQLLRKEIRFCHTLNPVYQNHEDELVAFQEAVDLVGSGKIPLEKVITHKIGFGGVEKALDMCVNNLGEVIKFVVLPELD